MINNNVESFSIDGNDNKWIGSVNGFSKYDNIKWTSYNSLNSGLPDNNIPTIIADKTGNMWIGTFLGGLAKFDGSSWTVYNTSNSGLSYDFVESIIIDNNNNKWVVPSEGGLSVFNENGVVTKTEKVYNNLPESFTLSQNFPNPFNPVTNINYSLPKFGQVTIKIYDVLGRQIRTLVNEDKTAGNYSVQFNGSNLSSGIYF